MKSEKLRLENISENSLYTTMSNIATIDYSFNIFKRYFQLGNILEMGPAEGLMTEQLYKLTDDLTLLDASRTFCGLLSAKYPDAEIICSLFEEYEPEKYFNNIILGHVLEHVINPIEILKLVGTWLDEGGVVVAAVPNSHSLHRQAAVLMGLLDDEKSMSDLDLHHGHRRVYDIEMLKSDFSAAGLNIIATGGYWLKPVSNKQIHDSWNLEMISSYMKLGEKYPDIAAEIYIVARK